jgi:hypothetical protein
MSLFKQAIEAIRKEAKVISDIKYESLVNKFEEFLSKFDVRNKWAEAVLDAESTDPDFAINCWCISKEEFVTCLFSFDKYPEVKWSEINVEWQNYLDENNL